MLPTSETDLTKFEPPSPTPASPQVQPGSRGTAQRIAGFVDDVAQLFCPEGHHIRRSKLDTLGESGYVRCGNVEQPGAPACEAELHVTWFQRRAQAPGAKPMLMPFVVEINWRDRQYIEGAQLDLFPVMEYLGQTYRPRVRHARERRAG